jgi:hypothetical protein
MARRRRRFRNREPVAIGGLLSAYLPKPVAAEANDERRDVVDEITWRRLVGVGIAKRTRPLSLVRGVLLVQVGSAAWAQQLSLLTDTVLERLAEKGLAVRQLRFRVGPVEPLRREPAKQIIVREVPRVPLPVVLREEIERVEDLELRAVLTSAASSNLAWQEGLAIARRRVVPVLPPAAKGIAPPGAAPRPGTGGPPGTRGGPGGKY